MEIILIASICAAFVGFVFGWIAGHARHNSVLRDMENALLAIEKENSALKDYEKFYRHHLTAAFGSPSPMLKDEIRQECTFHGFDAQSCMEHSKEVPCEPVNHNSIPDFLLEMSRQMRHQDSRSTSHPFWQVRCHRYIPTEQGYNDHHWEICGYEGVIYRSTDPIEQLHEYLIENHPEFVIERNEYHDAEDICDWLDEDFNGAAHLPDVLNLIYVQEIEEVVSTHFTEHDARGFIERQQHNYPKLYTYVESAYWSPQIRKLQDWIISLTAEQKNG